MILTLPLTAKRIKIIFLLFSFLTFFFYKTQAQQEITQTLSSYSYGNVSVPITEYPDGHDFLNPGAYWALHKYNFIDATKPLIQVGAYTYNGNYLPSWQQLYG